MMSFLAQYGLFALKALTLVIAFLLLIGGIATLRRKPKPKLEITSLNKQYNDLRQRMSQEIKKQTIKKPKKNKQQEKPILYVIDFHGDIKASQVEQLRDAISAVLSIVQPQDEVLLRLESPGGVVHGYGLAASQLQRIRDKGIRLTVCIDKIAASGGYLMACVANEIVAAPFAIIGSIGVVAQLPNFYRLLKKKDIDIELLTAGEYKRTLTLFAENTEKGRKKFQEDLDEIHHAFREHVLINRKQLDMDKVATGEHWLAKDALKLQLVDSLKTSDDFLCEKLTEYHAYKINVQSKKTLSEKLLKPITHLFYSRMYL